MNRRLIVLLGAIISVFAIAIVGASSFDLTGSDSAPGEGKTVAACAQNLIVKSIVDTSLAEANSVRRVDISGDMNQCVGQQMLVEIERVGASSAWAIFNITSPLTSLSLALEPATGAFYDSKPLATAGILQITGLRIAPVAATDFGLVTVTIAKTWE